MFFFYRIKKFLHNSTKFENEMFRLLSFKFLLMILWQEGGLGSTELQFKIIIGWMRKIIMLLTLLYIS